MGAELRGFDSLVVSGSRFIAAALLKPFAGTPVVWVARSGAKNHDGCNQLVDTAAVLCEWGWWDMNYSEIKYFDIANGEGVRTSLFVSGCRHGCPGCFNPEQWDFTAGKPFSPEVQNEILESLAPEYVDGLSLLGGEPMEPENQRALVDFVERVREMYPAKTIWCYTGDLLEDLQNPGELASYRSDRSLAGGYRCAGGWPVCAGASRYHAAVPGILEPAHYRFAGNVGSGQS